MSSSIFARLALCAALVTLGAAPTASYAQSAGAGSAQALTLGPSGLPLPRFVSLKSGRVNLRVGPGINYAVEWMYLKSGLPMEIVQEYDNWRKVRDADGTEGWINQSLLSGRRTAVVAPWQRTKNEAISLLAEARNEARAVAKLEPGVIGTLRLCNGEWCQMEVAGHRGWINQAQLWGAYPGETISD